MNKDRGIIKWLPFESLVSSKQVIDSILHEKNKEIFANATEYLQVRTAFYLYRQVLEDISEMLFLDLL